ncbi:Uncharacterised protein [Klebsiella pneumoniae]|nr:Uncharacterised protein [Klebsiella pneumoniae]SBZ37247.1 Uncharacterised protein [Klebsiella pneumoniae]
MCIARRRCACAGLRCLNQQRTRRPDKAFMPPSGTTTGTPSDVYRPASLRLRGPTLFEPAKGLVGRIRHLCRHPAQPRVRRLMCIARHRCACAGLEDEETPAGGPVGRIRHLCRHPAQPRVRRLMCIARRRCACTGLEDEETPAGDHLRPLRPKQYHRSESVPSGQHRLMEILTTADVILDRLLYKTRAGWFCRVSR